MARTETSADPATDWLDRRQVHVFVLALAVAIGYVWGIGSLPLFDLEEGAFTRATWAMFDRGDFLVPYLNDEPHVAGPVLVHWLQAASVAVFGFQEWAFRLPSVLASILWVAMIYRFADRYLNPRAAFFAALIPATALMTTLVGKAATSEAVSLLLLSGAVFATFNHWASDERRWIRWAYLAMALGFLAQGPVALVIPAATGLLFYLVTGKGRAWWRAFLDWRGLLLFMLVVMPWHLLVWVEHGQAAIESSLGRFDETGEGHSGGLWYYPAVALIALLPFTGVVLTSLRHFRSDWIRPLQAPESLPVALRRLGWIWFLVTLLLFSFSAAKQPQHLGYGLVGLMLVMASHLPQVRVRALHLLPVAAFLVLVLALPTLVNVFLDEMTSGDMRGMLAERDRHFGPAWYVVAGLSLLLVLMPLTSRRWPLPNVLVPAALSFAIVANTLLLHAVAQMQQGPIREAGLTARDLSGDLVVRDMNTPSFGVYAQRMVERREPREGDLLLTRNERAAGTPGEVLYARGGIVLMRVGEAGDSP